MRLKKIMAAVAAVALCVSSVGGATTAWAVENGGGTPEEEVVSYADLDDKDSYTVDEENKQIVYADYTLEFSVSDGTVTITGYTGKPGDVVIPESIDGVPVAAIGDHAFNECTSLTTVAFGSSLETIGERAFCCCTSLESFEVDENNSNFCSEDGVLFNKNKTELIRYPSAKGTSYTVPDGVTIIAKDAFCSSSLKSITLSSSVTTIGDYAFEYCTSLTTVDCSNVETIDSHAFYDCESLTTIDCSNVTTIGDEAFYYCTSLTEIDCSNAETIGNDAFACCYALTTIDCGNATTIGSSAFYNCKALTTIDCSSVETIGNYAFGYCESLTTIDCNNAKTIGKYAFEYCTALTTITCSSSLKSVGYCAFSGCLALSRVFYKGTAEAWDEISIDSGNSYFENATRYYIEEENSLGDIDGDGAVTAIDAHRCLVAYASEQVGQDTGLTDAQKALADVDGDGAVTAIDAHYMLVYYASQQVYDNVTWNDILS